MIVAVEGNEPGRIFSADYQLEEIELTPGNAFDGFTQIHDIKKFRNENSFFKRAHINEDSW